jgi:nucleoside-diphosphate-sugar epimerase
MIRFYRKFFRHEYPAPLLWLVVAGVGIRFSALAAVTFLGRALPGRRRRESAVAGAGRRADLMRILELRRLELEAQEQPPDVVPGPRPLPAPGLARKALVTGATGVVGHYLLCRLEAAGFEVHAPTRSQAPPRGPAGIHWRTLDIANGLGDWSLPDVPYAIHLAPLPLLPAMLPELADRGVRRLIAFGSTSRFTKGESSNWKEKRLASRLAGAEEALARSCPALGIAWTVFRPTLIYGGGRDRNISAIARFIRRFGFFPVVGEGRGRRQPVHAEDLAGACLLALECPSTYQRAYNLSGGSTLSYTDMVRAIFRGLNRRERILHPPLAVFRILLRCGSLLPGYSYLTADMADRMNKDLCFEAAEAVHDFGYSPRPFGFDPQPAHP